RHAANVCRSRAKSNPSQATPTSDPLPSPPPRRDPSSTPSTLKPRGSYKGSSPSYPLADRPCCGCCSPITPLPTPRPPGPPESRQAGSGQHELEPCDSCGTDSTNTS